MGSYEIKDIEHYLQKVLSSYDIFISLQPSKNTLCSKIKCSHPIDFGLEDSIIRLLGLIPRILCVNVTRTSDLPVTIFKVNPLSVECHITTGAYINRQRVHTIHKFFPAVPPGYRIVEVPSHVIYLSTTVQAIHYLQLKLIDQDGQLVNLRGEVVTIHLHIVINQYCLPTKVGKIYKSDLPCLMRNSRRLIRKKLTLKKIQFLKNLGLRLRVKRK